MTRDTDVAQSEAITSKILETSPVGIAVFDGDARIVRVNDRLADLLGATKAEILKGASELQEWPVYDEDGNHVPKAELPIRQAILTGKPIYNQAYQVPRNDDELFWCSLSASPIFDEDGSVAFVVVSVEDITEAKRREQVLETQTQELETVNQINRIIRDINRSLVSATTRGEIEQAVCDCIVKSGLYAFAWIGERHSSGVGLVPRARAGVDDRYFATLERLATNHPERSESWPSTMALTTGELMFEPDVAATESIPESIRAESLRLGGESAVAIPLRYDETVYAVLVVASTREAAFAERELDVLTELGESIGYAINAIQARRLLFSNSVIELEFELTNRDAVFARLSKDGDCRIQFKQMVAGRDGSLLLYCGITGATAETIESLAGEFPEIEQCRLIRKDDEETLFEFVVFSPSAVKSLMDLGGHISATVADRGVSRIRVEFPPDADVRAAVNAVRDLYPDAKLVAKRERDNPVETTREFRHKLDEQLTDRQRSALRAAYYAGYFDWPRGSTAEEIAASMGISSATFHQHLRAALRKRFSAFFGDDTDETTNLIT
ncbi:bacterio-opsin activator domain-containing protein [Haladaptatus sp. GCM10025707]|uniref:bacterio-opsin activator domain-containing protein n=1 Tax=unclassified Haladaptatus TaxID=2622732 RepID=UPI0023E855F7|nr:bacterio-opsin activator domain-containing protein [Haladaptatus sp. QDMS2]